MKKLLALILFGVTSLNLRVPLDGPCGIKGGGLGRTSQESDSLKNRNFSGKVNVNLTIDSLLKPGSDFGRFSTNDYASIDAYVYRVKLGGSESCNCKSKIPGDYDIHIDLVKDLNSVVESGIGCNLVVVEINRFTRADIDISRVKSLRGKRVRVQGWMFPDVEHKQNSVNTARVMTNVYRATIWEIHPVMFIKEI